MSNGQLNHSLKNRHIQMIALGGAIGTGLFLGSASAIGVTGPSIILSFIIGGIIIYGVMRALGEMTVDKPSAGSFMEYARENIGEGAGFVIGWNTWLLFTLACMMEAGAAGTLLDFWFHVPHWLTSLVFLCILGALNLINVKYFGETEFWFAGIKVAVILFMVISGFYILATNQTIQSMAQTNITNYQNPSTFFSHGATGFTLSLALVILSFCGSEFVSVAAGEAEDPKKSIPKAINGVVFRIILFYVLTIGIILLMYPYEKITPQLNPFADVFAKIGFSKSGSLINFVAITATLSALNSCIYVASRFLFSLSNQGLSLRIFSKLGKSKVPSAAVFFTMAITFSVVIASYIFPEKIMKYLFSIVGTGVMINWFIIMLSHLFFRIRKNKENKTKDLSYKMPGFPYVNIVIMAALLYIFLGMLNDNDMAINVYIAPVWLGVLVFSFLFIKKSRKQNNTEIDIGREFSSSITP